MIIYIPFCVVDDPCIENSGLPLNVGPPASTAAKAFVIKSSKKDTISPPFGNNRTKSAALVTAMYVFV